MVVSVLSLVAGFGITKLSYGAALPDAERGGLVAPVAVQATARLTATAVETQESSPTPQATNTPTSTATSTRTPTPDPTFTTTPNPTATLVVTTIETSIVSASGLEETCEAEVYNGIRNCKLGPYYVVRIDPKHPDVRFETVLPLGYDREGNYGECRDVNVPDTINPQMSRGPGCYVGNTYPGERVPHMVARYPGAVVGFNADFFSPTYAFGPMGLTVKNGIRLDGFNNDRDEKEVQRSSLSFSNSGEVRISIVDRASLPFPDQPWRWIPNQDLYYNTVGGLPILVMDGKQVNFHEQCTLEEGWCPARFDQRARTAVGLTSDGQVIVLIVTEYWGVTLQKLADLFVELGAQRAINLDGGGSSQLWYAGRELLSSPRPVAEGILVFSTLKSNVASQNHVVQ
jgi:Phosphodiester glycosidase